MELVTLSPPQISPSSQLSETASDTSAPEVPDAVGSTNESGIRADTSSTNGVPGTDDDKDPKKSKAHLHCPVCKVTVNSISQLEAHNSGKSVMCDLEACTFFLENRKQSRNLFSHLHIFNIWFSVTKFYISHYNLPTNSLLSILGTKHKLMLEGHSVLPRRRGKVVAARAGCKSKRLGSKGSVGVPSKNFQCEVCEIFVNSETQLSQVK